MIAPLFEESARDGADRAGHQPHDPRGGAQAHPAMRIDSSAPLTLWQSDLLAALPGVTHGVTTRVPGMGLADGNVGYSPPRDRADAWAMRQRWCAAAALRADHLVPLHQMHSARVHVVQARHAGQGARPGARLIGRGDALVTGDPGPVLMTLHADCQPLIFVDPARSGRGPVVAVAHAGWRGAVAGIVPATLEVMSSAFGSRVCDIHVALGPAIGACCYEVGEEVAGAWRGRAGTEAGGALSQCGDRYHFSVTAANAILLERAGVQPGRIETRAICTRCGADRWFSHRGQGPQTGRFGAMIAIDSPTKIKQT
jgi:YfiH family protein